MSYSFVSGAAGAVSPDTSIYLEKDILFNFHLSRLEGPATVVALNFRECILLRLLLQARVRKQAVIDAAWGDNGVVVTDASYHQLVRSLRKKFEEIGLPAQSIKTLPRFGLEYLRETPLQNAESASAAGVSTMDQGEPKPFPPLLHRTGTGGKKWTIRLLLLVLPFLAGLLIGHLDYRGNTTSALKADRAAGLAVSVLRNVSGSAPTSLTCDASMGESAIRSLRVPLARQQVNGSTRRFRCT